MANPVSLARGQITELTHIAPIRRGTVPGNPNLTYADRLAAILEAFNGRENRGFPSVIRTFRGIHHATWALIDGDTRLMLNVVFDGDWYDYMRALVSQVPGFLHLIWSNCEGWEPVRNEPERLFRFIKAYQVKVGFLYAQYPELTVKDLEWLSQLRALVEADPAHGPLIERVERALTPIALEQLRTRVLGAYDVRNGPGSVATARRLFERGLGAMYTHEELDEAAREAFEPYPANAGANQAALPDEQPNSQVAAE